jgi:hypothetical protein
MRSENSKGKITGLVMQLWDEGRIKKSKGEI